MVAGRTTEPRSVAVTKTSAAPTVTAPAGTFGAEDVGRTVTGTGVPAGATLLSVQSDTAATLSAAATASNSAATTIGAGADSVGFRGWSPESSVEATSYTVAAVNAGTPVPPGRQLNNITPVAQRNRS